MNADPAGTRYPHLDLGDLIAGAAGQPVGDRARTHLAACEHCQREANRWNLVADGVRGLAAAAPETAQPARPPRTRQRGLAGPWRRAVLVAGSAAAALVLLLVAGVAAGVVHVHFGNNGTETALTAVTAVTGCTQLQQADGTLEQVNGSTLVIKTASGQPVTVTTTATTFVSMSGPLLSDITDGASVMVRGPRSGGTIKAAIVTVGQPFGPVNPEGFVPVQGTVSDAGTAGFTLVTPGGTRVPVTTSGGTLVVVPHARPGQLQPGAIIFALGHAGASRTLSASAVAAISQPPSGPRLGVSVKVKDCSPHSVEEALGAISTAPASAG
ncbi:MAG: hypothetical protein ACLPUO_13905 [Streptosporangiaceae bacterium]|jgi:hypothetical protein